MHSAQITLIGAFNANFDADIGLDGIHLVQDRVLVASTLVGFVVAPVGSTISNIGLPVPPIGLPVTPIDPPVTPIGLPVAPVRRQVPLATSIALVGGPVAPVRHPVARLAGAMALRRDVAVQVRRQIAPLRRLLTFLRQLRSVDRTLRLLWGVPVPPFGDVVALVSDPVTPVGDTAALVSHAVTLVGGALAAALLGLGSHRPSLPLWGDNAVPDQS